LIGGNYFCTKVLMNFKSIEIPNNYEENTYSIEVPIFEDKEEKNTETTQESFNLEIKEDLKKRQEKYSNLSDKVEDYKDENKDYSLEEKINYKQNDSFDFEKQKDYKKDEIKTEIKKIETKMEYYEKIDFKKMDCLKLYNLENMKKIQENVFSIKSKDKEYIVKVEIHQKSRKEELIEIVNYYIKKRSN
jgi:hypothetical protein